jgi:hypothetical protein
MYSGGSKKRIKPQRFEVFTAVTMNNPVFWEIKTQCLPHRKHISSPLQSPSG